jgi:hypothetical protein
MDLKNSVDSFQVVQDMVKWRDFVNTVINLRIP